MQRLKPQRFKPKRLKPSPNPLVLDIGGEGRHARAWNLNPSPTKTIGSRRGEPIPWHIRGHANAIPFPDASVDLIIVERTPLRLESLREIARVVAPDGRVVLRHTYFEHCDPHVLALRILPGKRRRGMYRLKGQVMQETEFQIPTA